MPSSSDIPIPGAPLNSRTRKRKPIPRHLPGHIAGRYRVLSMLGRGATGMVVEAYDLLDDRLVALKLLKRECARDRTVLERFLQEARAMAKLDHPGVVKVFEHGVDKSGLHFLVMDIVKGLSVAEYIDDRGRMPARWVARLGMEICEVMQVAHNMKVVHRDLKPSNVLLPDGWFQGKATVRVVDFGTAKIATNTTSLSMRKLTGQGELVGTPQYMSPEQAVGRPITGRSDLYSLGCIMYELLSGHLPFDGPNHFAIIVGHLERDAVSLTELMGPQEAPPALTSIIRTLMAKEPDDRPISAEAVRAALHRMMGDLPATLSGERVTPPAQRRVAAADAGSGGAVAGGRVNPMGAVEVGRRDATVEVVTPPRMSALRPMPNAPAGGGANAPGEEKGEPPTRRYVAPKGAARASMPEPDLFNDSTTINVDPRHELSLDPTSSLAALDGLSHEEDSIPSFDLDMMSSVDEDSVLEPASASLSALVRHNLDASRASSSSAADTSLSEPRLTPFSARAAPLPQFKATQDNAPAVNAASLPEAASPAAPVKSATARLPAVSSVTSGSASARKSPTARLPAMSSVKSGASPNSATATVPAVSWSSSSSSPSSSPSSPPSPPAPPEVPGEMPRVGMGEAEGGVVEEGARGLTSSSAVESEADAGAPPLVEAPSARSYQAPEGLVEQDDLEVMGRGGRSAVFWLLSVGVVVLLLGVGAVFASTGFVLFAKRQPPEAVGAESEPEAQPGVADDSDGPSEDGDGAGVAQEVEQVGLNGAKSVGKAADEGSGDEAPAVAVKAGEFKVSLSSAPEGATIWRGDEKVGVTPMDVTLPPETTWPAVFLLTAPGRSSVYAVVEAPEEGQAALKSEHQLEPAGRGVARIEVLTETAGAEVFEEGVLVGFTPVHLARPRREGSVALSIVYDDQTTRKLRVGLGAQDVVLKVPDDKTADARPVAPRR